VLALPPMRATGFLFPCDARLRRAALACIAAIGLAACSPRVAGIYVDPSGATQYEFRPDGKVYISVLGATVTASYEVNAERILVMGPQGSVVLIRRKDRLEGPMGLELKRKPMS
ncbi:MAG TPA: hypothetical protein VG963_04420, partial [Polyangiaceae bacterium]|nr:hypothetical protein [Polyangiaceae bacterium]